MRDILAFHGRINRSNYRALNILVIGMIILVYFSPGVLIGLQRRIEYARKIELIQLISPYIHMVGFTIVSLFFILISIKRIRDTGNGIWKLLIPFWNFKILYFDKSI